MNVNKSKDPKIKESSLYVFTRTEKKLCSIFRRTPRVFVRVGKCIKVLLVDIIFDRFDIQHSFPSSGILSSYKSHQASSAAAMGWLISSSQSVLHLLAPL
jgi:hypothetical protein